MIRHKLADCASTLQILMSPFISTFLGAFFLLLVVSGCHTPLAVKQMQARNPLAKNAAKTPVEIVNVWNSYAHTTPEGKLVRGMAGRIHFYDNHNKSQTVKVDGDMTVFVFDGTETDPAHAKPFKVFQFESDTLDQHYSHQMPLGHGYNFFLPIDEVGGEEKPISIIVRFDDKLKDGFEVAQPVNTVLAGRRPQPPTEPTIREFLDSTSLHAEANRSIINRYDYNSVIQQVSHTEEIETPNQEPTRVTTIPLNDGMQRRLHTPN